MSSLKLRCVSWNILADGMSSNEFITNGGDEKNVLWSSRQFRICSILKKFLDEEVHVIGLQENDHPYFILHELQKFKPEMRCIHLLAKGASRSADKIRINSIFDYLNSNDPQFKEATASDSNKNAQDSDHLYSRINTWYKSNQLDTIKKYFTMTSFKEEHAEVLQKFLNRNPNDLYVANDGVSIYYDSNVMEFLEPIANSNMIKTEFPALFTGHDLACRFKILKSSDVSVPEDTTTFLNIICTHCIVQT